MILGRTYERFRIPPTHVGKITGRSSYARTGIEISCTCDLINPGWEGHVPLEIVNNLNHAVLIYPLLPLAQIFLMPLLSPATADYADRAKFKSKYMNDDGGPSYWWRDALVERLYRNYLSHRIDHEAIEKLNHQLEYLDDNGVFRFEKFLGDQKIGDISNADDLIASFVASERKSKLKYRAMRVIPWVFGILLLPTTGGAIYYTDKFRWYHWALFVATLLAGLWAFVSWLLDNGETPKFLTSSS
jgi:hypothetical protein